jgi:hypothetical protein
MHPKRGTNGSTRFHDVRGQLDRAAFRGGPERSSEGISHRPAELSADKSPYGPLLAQHGYVLDQNITFVHHGVEMQLNRLPHLVDELQASKVDVVLPGKSRPDSGTTLYVGAKRSIFDLLDASAVASVEHHALTDAGIGDGLAVS